jgi:hypothetical protein
VEILSDDADHDLVRKDAIYAEFGVPHRAYIEIRERYGWWCRLDGRDHTDPATVWQLPGWPPLEFDRAHLLA